MNEFVEITRRVRPLRTIWLALIAGVVGATVAAYYLIRAQVVTPVDALRAGLGIYVGLVLLIGLGVAPFVRRRLERAGSWETRSQAADKWQRAWLVGQAIKEGVGLGGLVLSVFVGSIAWALAFGVASVISMLTTPPWEADLLRQLRSYPPETPGQG